MAKRFTETILYALNSDGQMIHVDSVPRGLDCNCICPHCHAPLEARQGNKNTHAFSHAPGHTDCMHGYETGLHLRAKQIIEKEKIICTPSYKLDGCVDDKFTYFCTNDVVMRKGCNHVEGQLQCISAEAEIYIAECDIKPDVLVQMADGSKLMVEIFVTHAVDLEKQAKIEKSGISAIEIDLSQCDRNMTDEELFHYLCESARLTHWCFNSEQDEHNRWFSEWNKNIEKEKHEILVFDKDMFPTGAYLPFYWNTKSVEEWTLKLANHYKLQVGTPELNQKTFSFLFNHTKNFCSFRKLEITDEQIKNICLSIINNAIYQANTKMIQGAYLYNRMSSYSRPFDDLNRQKHRVPSYVRNRKHR